LDNNGKFSYSEIVIVEKGKQTASSAINVYPNPFKSNVYVVVSAQVKAEASITIIDIQGKVVGTKQAEVNEGVNNVLISDTDFLPSGIYFVKVSVNGIESHAKLIKE
jgi:hypothetical protein